MVEKCMGNYYTAHQRSKLNACIHYHVDDDDNEQITGLLCQLAAAFRRWSAR